MTTNQAAPSPEPSSAELAALREELIANITKPETLPGQVAAYVDRVLARHAAALKPQHTAEAMAELKERLNKFVYWTVINGKSESN